MKDIFIKWAKMYPLSQPVDFIKLAYQNRFGTGHMIADRQEAEKRLFEEWHSVKDMPREEETDIGGGYCIVSLKGLPQRLLPAVSAAFVAAASGKGSEEVFMGSLEEIKDLARKGMLPFDRHKARRAIGRYLDGGIRPTSHSRQYKSAYSPAYRVADTAVYRQYKEKLSKGE